ncbi:MAG: FGGY-family carbohydrate kinase, partial [Tannerellaceae bacterium]
AYNLIERCYENHYLDAADIPRHLLPEIIESDEIIGNLTPQAAQLLGLDSEVKVVCGGVDNSCMALGAKGIKSGRIYTSLGSSAWIALISDKPIIDFKYKPYVFAHVAKGLYTSATCIFSAGTSFKWIRDLCCQDILTAEQQLGVSAWSKINEMIDSSPAGANGVVFNPSLAGGSMLEPSPIMTGAFTGLKISNTRADILRATQEGIALNLRIALDVLLQEKHNVHQMLIVGGGAKSNVWMQIFADIYQLNIEKTSIDQEAASLGAAALALKGIGLWKDFSQIDLLHTSVKTFTPNHKTQLLYDQLLQQFKSLAHYIAKPL